MCSFKRAAAPNPVYQEPLSEHHNNSRNQFDLGCDCVSDYAAGPRGNVLSRHSGVEDEGDVELNYVFEMDEPIEGEVLT